MTDTPQAFDRNSIRSAIFGAKPETRELEVFGTKIELRQPPLGAVLENQTTEDRKEGVCRMLINYSYVPGTEQRVFEDADFDAILMIPFGKDMQKIQTAVQELTGVVVTDADKSVAPAKPPAPDGDDDGAGVEPAGGDDTPVASEQAA